MADNRYYGSGTEKSLFMLSRGTCYEPTCNVRVLKMTASMRPGFTGRRVWQPVDMMSRPATESVAAGVERVRFGGLIIVRSQRRTDHRMRRGPGHAAGGAMEPSQPPDPTESPYPVALAPFAERLLGVTVTRLWRVITVTAKGTIPLPGTLVLETDDGFVTLYYTQQGLSCRGPARQSEIRWDTEPELAMGRSETAEERLDLAPLEDQPNPPELPLSVAAVTGWFGVGSYVDVFALILAGYGRTLVIETTAAFDLQCASRQEARLRAEAAAANMNLRLVDQEARL